MRRLALVCVVVLAAERPLPAAVDYLRDIQPLLRARCAECHGALRQKSGLRADTAAALRRGGKSGPAFKPGDPAASPMLRRIASDDPAERMPPEGEALTAQQVAAITQWIVGGAVAPENEVPPADPRQHWSFQPPKRPALPASAPAVGNAIDAFLDAARAARGIAAAAPAPRDALLRRVCLDLTGLPPTPEELRAFRDDAAPDAYEKVVDRLLASPRYGERWGRHWMDIWRYSDWYGSGNEIRYGQRHLWRWRDWIIESLNQDRGYDRMLTEMLAGDEVAPADPAVLRATGYLGRNWYKFDRNVWLFETVEQTAQGMLALTLRCARCHDHKYDPISQQEYYQFRAFFEPHSVRTDLVDAAPDTTAANTEPQAVMAGLSRAYDATPEAPTYLFQRGDDRQPDKSKPLIPGAPAALGAIPIAIAPVTLPVDAYYPALQPSLVQTMLTNAAKAVQSAQGEHRKAEVALHAARLGRDAFLAGAANATAGPRAVLEDDFKAARTNVWRIVSGSWVHESGGLAQKTVGTFHTLEAQTPIPRDFCARVVYRTLEPGNFRSVGLFFDSVDLRDAQAVYTSISGGASTVQAFHREKGQEAYPAAGIAPHPLRVNETTTLDIAARGSLLNVWVDGKLALAYTMPRPRCDGRFALWVHSGAAVFYNLRVAALPPEFALAQSVAVAVPTPFAGRTRAGWDAAADAAVAADALAGAKVATALALQDCAQKRVAAERARVAGALDAAATSRAAALAELQWNLAKARQTVLEAGDAAKKAAAVKALAAAEAALANPGALPTPLGPAYPQQSSGRRLALARWMCDERNPRTARVAVNHIWLRHFGQALVPTVANFGVAGQPPSHPELLDWLAVELMKNGWRMKPLHRLMVTSQAYRRDSVAGAAPQALRDPENRLLWRMNPRRMEAEVVRDGLLAVAGGLDLTMGGAELPDTSGQTSARRSLYFRTTPDHQMPMLEAFDLANPTECYRRGQSVMPQQALVLMNSELALNQARTLARALAPKAPSEEAFVVASFEAVLSRAATREEIAAGARFLRAQSVALAQPSGAGFAAGPSPRVPASAEPGLRARENFVHVLMNHHDFVTIR